MSKKITKKLQKSISTMVMITTIVWMSGIAMVAPVFVEDVQAAYDKVTLTDITSTSQKIAPNGESVLGVVKLEMTASDIGTGYKTLKYLTTTFAQVSGTFAAGTATSLTGSATGLEDIANSTSSGIQLYQDSGTTAGVFDSEDGRVAVDVTGTTAHTSLAYSTSLTGLSSNYMTTLKSSLIFGTDGVGGPTISTSDASPSIFYLVLLTDSAGTTAGAFTATVDGAAYIDNSSSSYAASIAPTSFVTRNITPGTDGVAPTISKVETYDNTPDGVVDRIKVYFSESMSSGVTATDNFVNALGGTASKIEAGATDIALNSTGTWSTTTILNDTLTIDISNAGTPYTNGANSTGDTWTVVYDQDKVAASALTDATGTELLDKSITTTDMARPYLMTDNNATLHDVDGDGQIDELRVKFSETLGSASDATGFTLRNTTGSTDYTLGAVNGFVTSATSANANDTIKIAVAESGSSDLNDSYTLAYAEQTSGGIVDVAGNTAVSRSAFAPTLAANPTVTKIEIKDADADGKIDAVEVTCSCTLTEVGSAEDDFAVAGYTIASASATAKVFTIVLTEGSVYDTNIIPDVTYVNDGTADGNYLHCGDTNFVLENVTGDMFTEADKAAPILISATLYETDSDDIWDSGETVQLFFSEPVDPTSIATSWSGDVFGDFTDNLGAADRPDSGTMEIQGKVVVLTASENATTAMTTSDYIRPVTNEVKDSAGNSAPATTVTLTVTPTTAPTVDQINTLDENGNGLVDALAINFNGIVDGSTITASDFAAARGSNFSINATTEAATSTSAITPDLTISEVVAQNGGNDSVIIVRFAEVGENTGAHPQAKYVQGALADLAGNKVATFNAYSSDNTKFETAITSDTKDKVAPKVMEIRLKDRNANNKYDQLMVTYSEAIKNDAGSAAANGALSSTGWAVADHTIAASGAVYDNTNTALTYATTNAVYKVDINEISGSETAVPEVTYSASGITKDAWNNPLAAIAEGDVTEVSEITDLTPVTELVDGDVARIGSAEEVYVIKLVGSNKYKRHIVSPMVFNSYGHLSWDAIKSVSSLDDYSLSAWVRVCTGANGAPAATDKVYEVNADSTMHWLNMTAAQFYARGGSDEAIYNVNDGELGLYTLGVDVLYE
jgi:hypothetical protein